MTIRRAPSGKYFCDGRECGYPLDWLPADPIDGDGPAVRCLDCGAMMGVEDKPAD